MPESDPPDRVRTFMPGAGSADLDETSLDVVGNAPSRAAALHPTVGPTANGLVSEPGRTVDRQTRPASQELGDTSNVLDLADFLQATDRLLRPCIDPIVEAHRRVSISIAALRNDPEIRKLIETLRRWSINAQRILVGLSHVIAEITSTRPSNLLGIEDLESVARLSLDEGIPVAWIPRSEILTQLLEAPDASARIQVLDANSGAILDDCDSALKECRSLLAEFPGDTDECTELTVDCAEAIRAFAQGLYGPAQSHAANVVDSIVRLLSRVIYCNRDVLGKHAEVELDTLPSWMPTFGHYLSVRPLRLAYVSWYPGSDEPPPNHFARHPTVHALGYQGVKNQHNALIAVMLATSLTRQLSLYVTKGHFYADLAV